MRAGAVPTPAAVMGKNIASSGWQKGSAANRGLIRFRGYAMRPPLSLFRYALLEFPQGGKLTII